MPAQVQEFPIPITRAWWLPVPLPCPVMVLCLPGGCSAFWPALAWSSAVLLILEALHNIRLPVSWRSGLKTV